MYIQITSLELTAPKAKTLSKVVCIYWIKENNSYNIRTINFKIILNIILFFFNRPSWLTTKENQTGNVGDTLPDAKICLHI